MKYLVWDFDGTLGYRQNGLWSAALMEILQRYKPDCRATIDQVRSYLKTGFPWHTPERPHPDIKTPEQWWDALDGLFVTAYLGLGLNLADASHLAKQVRHLYPKATEWRLYDDVLPVLSQLSAAGWTHLVLSNHVPELRQITRHLSLDQYLAGVFNSAETGYEKPHPQAFRNLLLTLDNIESIWMIGDSLDADIAGAREAGIDGILVRKQHPGVKYSCLTLYDIEAIVDENTEGETQ